MTLHWLGDHPEVPHELLRRAKNAGASVEIAPFGVVFDRIGSFGSPEMGGLALTSTMKLKEMRQLQRALAAAMEASEIGHHIRKGFTPHVSLLYCRQRVVREPIAPIRWRVDELVLIDSLLGHGEHVDKGNRPLRSRQMSLGDW